jgi:hypothetical protein
MSMPAYRLRTPSDLRDARCWTRTSIPDVLPRVMRGVGVAVLLLVVSSCAPTESSVSSALVVDDWDGKAVSTLCVSGEEDYGSGPNAATPVQEGIASFFGDIVVDDGCDATIRVSLVGEARSATYNNPDSPGSRLLLYTGAEVEGTMSMSADGKSLLTAPIAGYVSPPQSIDAGASTPRAALGAPFWGAAYDRVCKVLQHWFGADDPNLSPCPEPVIVTFTTVAGHTPWPEALRADFLDTCLEDESVCLCLLYGAESVLTEGEWLSVRDLNDMSLWPEGLWVRVDAVWGECS